MRNQRSYIRVAVLAFAMALVSVRSPFQPLPSPAVRAGEPIAADLVAAIRNADGRAIGLLLAAGADVNARDAEGNTPLILASLYASPECVKLLIQKGADVNAANKAGATALIRAATNYESTRLLVDAGAKVRVQTALSNTPLILAVRRAGPDSQVAARARRQRHGAKRRGRRSRPLGRRERRSGNGALAAGSWREGR